MHALFLLEISSLRKERTHGTLNLRNLRKVFGNVWMSFGYDQALSGAVWIKIPCVTPDPQKIFDIMYFLDQF